MGGTWKVQNKVRPGAYINVKGVPQSMFSAQERGVGAIGLSLDWGADDEVIEILSSDLIDGSATKKIGTIPLALEVMLSECYKACVYKLNTGGAKASASVGGLTVNALYKGTYGNSIRISVVANGSQFDVNTFVGTDLVDVQTVSNGAELVANDFVTFSGTTLSANAGTTLTGGSNGSVSASTGYQNMFKKLKGADWNCLAIVSDKTTANPLAKTFIEDMRENEGRKVQVALNDTAYDYEGVIQSTQGFTTGTHEVTAEIFPAYVCGVTANANYNESNTARFIEGATSIIGEKTSAEIQTALKGGQFCLSYAADGSVKVEQDINSLHTFSVLKGYTFSKNRVIRTLDEIANTIVLTFERFYMGKVSNNDSGRTNFKGDVVGYLNGLMNEDAIKDFVADDVEVLPGQAIDSVVVNLGVTPVDAIEKMYITVNVG